MFDDIDAGREEWKKNTKTTPAAVYLITSEWFLLFFNIFIYKHILIISAGFKSQVQP